ncbi:hypothetical protein [Sphingomonas aerolata]|uniref:hypothetical protein n=1 Tax=Sphingomonas aerolata TaxID=185951 RepID=UPI00208FB2E0|nr:hypothetical protein [Sphingomonas aerolata]USR00121.1 hypothetical protein NEF64_17310 [Sphingomonas aerolata]
MNRLAFLALAGAGLFWGLGLPHPQSTLSVALETLTFLVFGLPFGDQVVAVSLNVSVIYVGEWRVCDQGGEDLSIATLDLGITTGGSTFDEDQSASGCLKRIVGGSNSGVGVKSGVSNFRASLLRGACIASRRLAPIFPGAGLIAAMDKKCGWRSEARSEHWNSHAGDVSREVDANVRSSCISWFWQHHSPAIMLPGPSTSPVNVLLPRRKVVQAMDVLDGHDDRLPL